VRFPHVCVSFLKLVVTDIKAYDGISIACRRRKNAKVLVLLQVRRNLERAKLSTSFDIKFEPVENWRRRQRRTCRPELTRVMVEHLLPAIAGKKISWNQFLARFFMQMWLCWRMFPQAPCLVHLGSCPVKTNIAPRGIWAKISLLTLLRERWNSDLTKDIFRPEEHLNRLCNWYELYCWSNISLHLVQQQVINISHALCIYLITPEESLKVYFPSYLETKISVSEAASSDDFLKVYYISAGQTSLPQVQWDFYIGTSLYVT